MSRLKLNSIAVTIAVLAAGCSPSGDRSSVTDGDTTDVARTGTTGDGSASSEATVSASSSTGVPPTHDLEYTPEALFERVLLEGTLNCLWARRGNERTVLVLPAGSWTVQDSDEVVLFDSDNNEIARTGDRIDIVGGFVDDGFVDEPMRCASANTTAAFLVGRFDRVR